MTIASECAAFTRAGSGVGSFLRIAVALIAVAAGTDSAPADNPGDRPAHAVVIPVQLSMDRKTAPNAPPPKKSMSVRPRSDGELTPGEQRRLAEAIDRMAPKERKRLAKAMKHLTPEERRQLAEVVKRHLGESQKPSQAPKAGK